MRGMLVAIDLETTGLDPANDHIIEIGAVKFRENEILETYTTLVDPGISIPPKVTDITGIKMEDLVGAPKIAEVLPKVVAFAGSAPIVGHNVEFDLSFLRRQNVLTTNEALDTYELASVLMPTASRYNLNALMQILNIAPEGAYHRALTDAIADTRLYMALWSKLLKEVPYELLREIVGLAQGLPAWGGKASFEAALKIREGERPAKIDPVMRAFTPPEVPTHLLEPSETRAAQFEPAGHTLYETADSGALWTQVAWDALRQNEQFVIAVTPGIVRQRLLSDLQALQGTLPLRVATLRRRSEYVCPAQLNLARKQPPTDVETLRLLAKTLVWLGTSGKITPGTDLSDEGHAERLSIRGPGEQLAWARLSADVCTHSRCDTQMHGICPLFKDRLAAQHAHVVVVDQALLLADARSHDPIVPDYRHILINDAHALEESLTDALHTRQDAAALKRQAAALGKQGIFAELLATAKPAIPEKNFEALEGLTKMISEAAGQMKRHVDNLFKSLQAFLETIGEARATDFVLQIRLTQDLHHKPAFSQVRAAWSILGQFTETLAESLGQLAKRVAKYNLPDGEHLRFVIDSLARAMAASHHWLNDCLNGPGDNTVYWVEVNTEINVLERLSLHAAPLNLGPLLQKHLWDKTATAMVADTTLRTTGTFDYVQGRLGARDFKVLTPPARAIPDDQRPLMIYLPTDMPEPNDKDRYQKQVERGIIELTSGIQGRVLALFGGFTQLRQSGQHIAARLALGGISTFDQSDGTSFATLRENLRNVKHAAMLGVRGQWEDSDLSDIDLSALVIVRLPFAVPSDPLYGARAETYDDPFNQYTVPGAILRFRQSVERLMRFEGRRGIVLVLDRRMTSKDYGSAFLESLPPCTVKRAPLGDLPAIARDWLADGS